MIRINIPLFLGWLLLSAALWTGFVFAVYKLAEWYWGF